MANQKNTSWKEHSRMNYLKFALIFIMTVTLIGAGCNSKDERKELAVPTDIETNDVLGVDTSPTDQDGSGAENEDNEVKPKMVKVKYTQYGFIPDPMIINAGDTVQFSNDSEEDFRPVADDASFDAKENLGKSQSFKFTFDKTGEINYHNHLDTSQTGTIIVR